MSDPLGGGLNDVLVDIRTQGIEGARETRQELENIGRAGGESAGRLANLTTAYERLERREPTLVLREARMEIASLGAEALGSSGPLGRLGASLAMFAAGSGVAAGVIGIAAAFKLWIDYADQLDPKLHKLNDEFAAMSGPGAQGFARLGNIQAQLEGTEQPGFWERALDSPLLPRLAELAGTTLGGPGVRLQLPGLGELGAELGIDRQTEGATFRGEIDRLHEHVGEIHAEDRKRHDEALKRHREEMNRPVDKTVAEERLRETRGDAAGEDFLRFRRILPFASTDEPNKTRLGQLLQEKGADVGGEANLAFRQIAPSERDAAHRDMEIARAGVRFAGSLASGRPTAGQVAGSALESASAIATASGVGAPIGAGLEAAGGLISLVGHGGGQISKVQIDSFSEQAKQDMKTVRDDALTTSYSLIAPAAEVRSVTYQQGRDASKGVVTRSP